MKRHHVRVIAVVLIAEGVIRVRVWLWPKAPAPITVVRSPAATEALDPAIFRDSCELVRVIDGDTIDVQIKAWKERVRLLRINTPERGQPGFEESKRFLQDFLKGKSLELEFEQPDRVEPDRYNRLLC